MGLSDKEDPNSLQIGGDHYRTGYQVWDFTEKHGLGGLEMYILKYLCRWRAKGNGTQDLEKAVHCVDKLIDLHKNMGRVPKGCASELDIALFCSLQNLTSMEKVAVHVISRWSCVDELAEVRAICLDLIVRHVDGPA